ARLRAVVEYIEEHLDGCPTLAQMAAVVRLNPYHFARQFKAATGLPPHQYVIARRVERAKQLLQGGRALPLAQVAAVAGFSARTQSSARSKARAGPPRGRSGGPERTAARPGAGRPWGVRPGAEPPAPCPLGVGTTPPVATAHTRTMPSSSPVASL